MEDLNIREMRYMLLAVRREFYVDLSMIRGLEMVIWV